MIARTETHSDRERILALLSPRSTDACVRQVFADIDEINRLMEYYSFRTPQLADRFADMLEARYRYEIFAIYGPSLLLRRSSDSSYLRLDQLLSSLIRVAVPRRSPAATACSASPFKSRWRGNGRIRPFSLRLSDMPSAIFP